MSLQVRVNGAAREVAEGTMLPELLQQLGLALGSVVVERNGDALRPSEIVGVSVDDGDVLELVRAVAGG